MRVICWYCAVQYSICSLVHSQYGCFGTNDVMMKCACVQVGGTAETAMGSSTEVSGEKKLIIQIVQKLIMEFVLAFSLLDGLGFHKGFLSFYELLVANPAFFAEE